MNSLSKFSRCASTLIMLVLLLVACAPIEQTQPSAATPLPKEPTSIAPETEAPLPTTIPEGPQGTVTVALTGFGRELFDQSLCGTPDLVYKEAMFDWFIGTSPEGKPSPDYGVVENWEPNADATVWTFTLHSGVNWHDGVEMTSEDIKFSVEHYSRPEAVCTQCGVARNVDHVEIVDRYTARLHLKNADVNLAAAFGSQEGDLKIFPKHYYEKVGAEGFEESPLGSGPWKYVDSRPGEYIEFEANTDYWNPARIPGFAKLRLVAVPEGSTRLAMLRTGEADMIAISPQDVAPLKEEGYKLIGPKNGLYTMVFFAKSYDPSFLTNKLEFRKALILAIDMDAVIEAFYPPEVGERYRGGSPFFSPVTLGYDPNLPPYPYDPEEAKRLLEEVGYNNEPVTYWSFAFSGNPEQMEVNEAIASYWRDIGINVKLTPVDWGAFRPWMAADPQEYDGPADVWGSSPTSRPSVLNNMRVHFISKAAGGNAELFPDQELADAYFAELLGMADLEERNQRLLEINREFYDLYWAIPIALRNAPYALGPRVADWKPTTGISWDMCFETLMPAP